MRLHKSATRGSRADEGVRPTEQHSGNQCEVTPTGIFAAIEEAELL
jgi:hypothetical protein